MKFWVLGRFQTKSQKSNTRRVLSARPELELLEDRVVPALINHGGAVLSSVQVQALYLGSNWQNDTNLNAQAFSPTHGFDNFLSTTVSGSAPYLAMLKAGGFGVDGSGGFTKGAIDSSPISSTLTDSAIQAALAKDISGHALQTLGDNTLYVVFVQPGTVVDLGGGQNSTNTFLAYHSWFTPTGSPYSIRYAVVPYHGSAGNAQDAWLPLAFDSMTLAASHEIAEAITDPDGNTWYDRSGNENGDIVNGSTVYLNGYAVQREASIPGSVYNYLPMTPVGAAVRPGATVTNLTTVAKPKGETGTIAFTSAPGIDDFGQPMIDVVFSDGNAYEYHDFLPVPKTSTNPTGTNPTVLANPSFFPWTSLGSNVSRAVAGQGVSYVLLTNGNLGEYVDPNYNTYNYGYGVNPGSRNGTIVTNVATIVAGTDQIGANAVEYTLRGKSTTTYEWRDVTGKPSTPAKGTFNPASHAFLVGGTFGLGSPSQDFTASAAPVETSSGTPSSPAPAPTAGPTATPAGPQAQVAAAANVLIVQVTSVAAVPVTGVSLVPIVPPYVSLVPPTARDAAVILSQSPLRTIRPQESAGNSEIQPLPDEGPSPERVAPEAPALLPDNFADFAPATPAAPLPEAPLAMDFWATVPPLSGRDAWWVALDETDCWLEGQPVSVAGEGWAAPAEEGPTWEENGAPTLGPAVAVTLALALVGAPRPRRGQARLGWRHLPFAR